MTSTIAGEKHPAQRVAVVVLSWNRRSLVDACVDRLSRLEGITPRVIIVDNASTDGSAEFLAARHPHVTVLESSSNEGFAGAVNRGLETASAWKASHVWLLNDDTEFEPDTLRKLVDFAHAHPHIGLVTPLLVDTDTTAHVQFANGLIDWSTCQMHHNLEPSTHRQMLEAGATEIVPGTALLCDMRLYHAIGPFDTRYFAYWEDVDYSVRAHAAGYGCAVAHTVVMRHAATRGRQARPPHYAYYMIRNEALFWRLHHQPSTRIRAFRRWLGHALLWAGESRAHGNSINADACIDGIWHAVTRRYGTRDLHRAAPNLARRILLSHPWILARLVTRPTEALQSRFGSRGRQG